MKLFTNLSPGSSPFFHPPCVAPANRFQIIAACGSPVCGRCSLFGGDTLCIRIVASSHARRSGVVLHPLGCHEHQQRFGLLHRRARDQPGDCALGARTVGGMGRTVSGCVDVDARVFCGFHRAHLSTSGRRHVECRGVYIGRNFGRPHGFTASWACRLDFGFVLRWYRRGHCAVSAGGSVDFGW